MPDLPNKCSEYGIPSYLHRINREIDNDFLKDNFFYRRFDFLSLEGDGIKSSRAFDSQNCSVNRDFYSKSPEDVLFSANSINHYFKWGILEINKDIIGVSIKPDGDSSNEYHISLIHAPEDCIYPHSMIQLLKNGNYVEKIKPTSVKNRFRDILKKHSKIIKKPEIESI